MEADYSDSCESNRAAEVDEGLVLMRVEGVKTAGKVFIRQMSVSEFTF